jgi:hypothetical protein
MSHTNWCSLVLTSGDGRVREACDCGAIDDPQRDLAKRLADDAHTRTKCTGYKEAA